MKYKCGTTCPPVNGIPCIVICPPSSYSYDFSLPKDFNVNAPRGKPRGAFTFLIFDFSIVFLLMILIKIILSNIFIIVLTIYGLVSFFPSISVIVRRLHDFNISWWSYFFFYCVSMIIIIYLMIQDGSIRRGVEMSTTTSIFSWLISIFQWLVLLCIKGTSGSNHYGKPPIN